MEQAKEVTFYHLDAPGNVFSISRDMIAFSYLWHYKRWPFSVNDVTYECNDWRGREAAETLFGEPVRLDQNPNEPFVWQKPF